MKVPVYNRQGSATSEVELAEDIFAIEPNEHVMYLAVKVQRARMRQGTHASKNRSLVSGGGRKPWRQKGRGTARAGTSRSPLWRHGGTIFGPQPHPYNMRLPKKVNRLARASALACRVAEEAFTVVEDFKFEAASTKSAVELLKAFELEGKKVLILTKEYDQNLLKSVTNIPGCDIAVGIEASTLDLLNHDVLLVQQGVIEPITEVLSGRKLKTTEAA